MPEINGVNDYTYSTGIQTLSGTGGSSSSLSVSGSGSGGLDISDFYKLLAAQIQYQDADNPMDTSQMMSQMVQTQMIQAINQMSQVNVITYANSLIGKEVTMAELDALSGQFNGETSSGMIEGMIMGDDPILFVGGKQYRLNQIMSIGTIPDDTDDSTTDEATEGEV